MRSMPIIACALAALLSACALTSRAPGVPLVAGVEKAPITPDGNVAGRPINLVVNLAIAPDPWVPGRSLRAGRSVRTTLPREFVDTGTLPLLDYGSDPRCGPQRLGCNTAAFLQGWPQNPVPFRSYTVHLAGAHTIVLTAREDIGYVSELAPGIKGVHLILPGFRNPAPGRYTIGVESETGPNGAVERGTGEVEIVAATSPSIGVSSMFDQPAHLAKLSPPRRASSTDQLAAAGSATPLPYNFLLWDALGEPMTGVTLGPLDAAHGCYALLQNSVEVGRVTIEAPRGARGQQLIVEQPSFAIKAPISAVPAARLRAQFIAGDRAGDYAITFALHGGNSARMRVRMPEAV